MWNHVFGATQANIDYARKLVADIPDERMCVQPYPAANHAAWVLGHLAYVFDSMTRVWGQQPTMPREIADLFKVGSQPTEDRSKYPSKAALWEMYEQNCLRVVEIVKTAPPEKFNEEFPNPRLRFMLPTIGVAMVHILTSHQGVHLGQLSAWRRAQGLSGVLTF